MGAVKISKGIYEYKGYRISNCGYYEPDHCIWWEAVDMKTGCADMRKLIEQLMKFGLVGVIAFIIDWGILNLLVGVFRMHNVLAATISFIISLIFNYIASMKLVFKHRDDMARWMEILIFVVAVWCRIFLILAYPGRD